MYDLEYGRLRWAIPCSLMHGNYILENLTAFICKVQEVIQTGKHQRIDIREGKVEQVCNVPEAASSSEEGYYVEAEMPSTRPCSVLIFTPVKTTNLKLMSHLW